MIIVTAPTGDIGHQVVENLLKRGVPVRVIVRDRSKLSKAVRERVEIVEGSHADADVVNRAFEGRPRASAPGRINFSSSSAQPAPG